MKQTIYLSDFREAFIHMGRGKQFSYDGLEALFDFLEECEDPNDEMELDVIALCCEFSEYPSAIDCINDCGYGFTPSGTDEEEQEEEALDYLNDNTIVIPFDGGIIIQNF